MLWFLPAEKVPAHVLMTRSNLGAIECVRHSNHFDVCLLLPEIWELVLNCSFSSKFVFYDILAEMKDVSDRGIVLINAEQSEEFGCWQ